MLNLLHKKCKLGGYVRGQMPKNANVICEGSLMINRKCWFIPAVIQKYWARDGKWKAPWLHGRQLHYFQRWCFGLHSLFCKGPFQSSTSGWTSTNCWWIGPGWRSSPQQNMNHECCSWRERSTSQLIGYLDALFASSLSHRSLWLCQPVKQIEKNIAESAATFQTYSQQI